jgi:hypothetical protein
MQMGPGGFMGQLQIQHQQQQQMQHQQVCDFCD